MDIKGRSAIVTGSSSVIGIGAETARAIAAKGCNVVINYVNNEKGAEETVAACRSYGVKSFAIKGDVSKDQTWETILDEVDYVFHLAARAGVRGGWGNIFDAYQYDNVTSTQRLLEVCRISSRLRQFILASTSSIYGRNPPLPTPEGADSKPQSYYAISKLACEKLGEAYLHHFKVPITTLRFYTLYGPRQRPDMAFHIFLRALMQDEGITIFGDGSQTREVTYVHDAIDAILLSLGEDRIGRVFNIGGGTYKKLNGYLDEIENVTGLAFRRHFAPIVQGDQLHSRADLTLARNHLGYRPQWSLYDGLEAEYNWVRDVYRGKI